MQSCRYVSLSVYAGGLCYLHQARRRLVRMALNITNKLPYFSLLVSPVACYNQGRVKHYKANQHIPLYHDKSRRPQPRYEECLLFAYVSPSLCFGRGGPCNAAAAIEAKKCIVPF